MCDSHLQASDSHLQDFHSHLQVLPSGSSNTDLNLLDMHCLVGFYICDLEDLRALIEPSLRSGFYIEPFSLPNPIETSKTVSN